MLLWTRVGRVVHCTGMKKWSSITQWQGPLPLLGNSWGNPGVTVLIGHGEQFNNDKGIEVKMSGESSIAWYYNGSPLVSWPNSGSGGDIRCTFSYNIDP